MFVVKQNFKVCYNISRGTFLVKTGKEYLDAIVHIIAEANGIHIYPSILLSLILLFLVVR